MNTIFPKLSLDRSEIKWEDYLADMTPFENHEGVWFKRDDYFAPLGYNGPNGSKCRQLIYMMTRQKHGKTHVVTGASIQSPQLSMSAIVGAHLGLPTRMIVYSKPHTVLTHPNPRIAAGFGAVFEYAKAPYNPTIQSMVKGLIQDGSLYVPYGISLDHHEYGAEEITQFHSLGANQVSNLPDEVERLIVPAGSCNSLCSVLLGLNEDSKNVKQLYMIGIGPDKMKWVQERMEIMGVNVAKLPFDIRYENIQTNGYSSYSDKFTGETWDGINFHPTYEGKMWRWLMEQSEITRDSKTAFWIVGAEGFPSVVEPFYTHEVSA